MCFEHITTWTVTLRIPRMREANSIILKFMCEEQHAHNKSGTSNMHGLVHHYFAAGPAAK